MSKGIIIPDQLNITIRTSLPGNQKFEYRPSMTIQNSDEKGIKFNPLIKLNQKIIDKIPEEYRIRQFFNKDLFSSLLDYTLYNTNGKKAKTLKEATFKGYVDNNIKITLDTIFSVNSVIYINGKPYVISDVQWTNGEWKISNKTKTEEIDISKIKNPFLYNQLADEEIDIGKDQLKMLPQSVIEGENYSGGSKLNYGIKKYNSSKSKLAYFITIDMELHPGTSISEKELYGYKCNSKYNSIRKSYSELTGKPYIIPPVYKKGGKKINDKKTRKNKSRNNKTRRNKIK
jgi:hypothetical protein